MPVSGTLGPATNRARATVRTASRRFTASSSFAACSGGGSVMTSRSATRAISLISGKPYDPPEPARRWNPVRSAGSTFAPWRNDSMSARRSANILGSSSRYSRCSSRYASSWASLMRS